MLINIFFMRFLENEKLGVESQTFGRQCVKIQAAATIAYGGLLFPPERGEHGNHLSARASGSRQRLPDIPIKCQ